MTKPLELIPPLAGLSDLAGKYKAIVCDVWGVLHNGKIGYVQAGEALLAWRERTGMPAVLLTNAPRPAELVAVMLDGYGISRESYDAIVTSGDVARNLIVESRAHAVYHLGPERDLAIYDGLDAEAVDEDEAEIVVCTGLVDDDTEEPEDYRPQFERFLARNLTMICANPDIVVERGENLIWCAGALARLYEEMGGMTITIGKPYPSIYEAALREIARLKGGDEPRPEEVLAIGDGLPTDIKGAAQFGLNSLFITAGIHAADFGAADAPDPMLVTERLQREGFKPVGFLPRLKW